MSRYRNILAAIVATCCLAANAGYFGAGTNRNATGVTYGTNAVTAIYSGSNLVWSSYVSWPNLVSRWKFDGNANDSTGTNNGEWTGTEAYASGHDGQAASLDGSSYIQVSTDGSSVFALQEYTVSAWVYSSDVNTFLPVWSYDFTSHVSPQYAQSVAIYADNSIVYAWNYSGAGVNYISTSSNAIADGQWHHVAATFVSGTQRLYVDGVIVASGASADTVTYYAQPVWIGHSNFATAVPCLIDDVMFFNAALSSNNVNRVMQGLPPL